MNFHERKAERTAYYKKYVEGWKLRPCGACNGSGYYDSHDSPDCGACDGSGKESYNPKEDMKLAIEYHGIERLLKEYVKDEAAREVIAEYIQSLEAKLPKAENKADCTNSGVVVNERHLYLISNGMFGSDE